MLTKTLTKLTKLKIRGQYGLNSFAAVGAITGIGVVFILIFLFVGTPSVPTNKDKAAEDKPPAAATSDQPSVIRLPDNYKTYVNKDYKFSFAYPSAWGDIAVADKGSATFLAQSGPFSRYALGGSVLDGQVSVYVYPKDAFKLSLGGGGALVSPVKLGDTYGWKVVQTGVANPTLNVGDSYNVKSAKYQAGIPIYDFTITQAGIVQGRWTFQSGDNFVVVVLPVLSRSDNSAPTGSDLNVYKTIGNNMAKTMRPTL